MNMYLVPSNIVSNDELAFDIAVFAITLDSASWTKVLVRPAGDGRGYNTANNTTEDSSGARANCTPFDNAAWDV